MSLISALTEHTKKPVEEGPVKTGFGWSATLLQQQNQQERWMFGTILDSWLWSSPCQIILGNLKLYFVDV